jgi:hypothetical protein
MNPTKTTDGANLTDGGYWRRLGFTKLTSLSKREDAKEPGNQEILQKVTKQTKTGFCEKKRTAGARGRREILNREFGLHMGETAGKPFLVRYVAFLV